MIGAYGLVSCTEAASAVTTLKLAEPLIGPKASTSSVSGTVVFPALLTRVCVALTTPTGVTPSIDETAFEVPVT